MLEIRSRGLDCIKNRTKKMGNTLHFAYEFPEDDEQLLALKGNL